MNRYLAMLALTALCVGVMGCLSGCCIQVAVDDADMVNVTVEREGE